MKQAERAEREEEMLAIQYDSFAYGADVTNGRVRYYKEYSINGRIVFTEQLTERQYTDALWEEEK